jgi:hypothetical protein
MSAKPRRRRGSGTLGQLKARLWAVIEYNVGLVEDETADHELRLKGSTTLVQAALAYARVMELYDLEGQVKSLEQLAHRNGHHAA